MGIHDHARFMKYIPPDHIRGFSAHTCQRCQILKAARHFSAKLYLQIPAAGNDIFRLVMIKSGGVDILFQLFQVRICESTDCRVFLKQILRYDIDPRIRTLCAQDRSDQKLPRIFMVQIAFIIRPVLLFQQIQYLFCPLFHSPLSFPAIIYLICSAIVYFSIIHSPFIIICFAPDHQPLFIRDHLSFYYTTLYARIKSL